MYEIGLKKGIVTKSKQGYIALLDHQDKTKELVRGRGLDDFIVVDTKDVLLICSKEKEQSIKEYVAEVKRNKGDQYI